jgi:hypothetical protein
MRKPAPSKPVNKQPYSAPKLVVHGSLAAMTKATGSSKGDGSNKPATRGSGSNN